MTCSCCSRWSALLKANRLCHQMNLRRTIAHRAATLEEKGNVHGREIAPTVLNKKNSYFPHRHSLTDLKGSLCMTQTQADRLLTTHSDCIKSGPLGSLKLCRMSRLCHNVFHSPRRRRHLIQINTSWLGNEHTCGVVLKGWGEGGVVW